MGLRREVHLPSRGVQSGASASTHVASPSHLSGCGLSFQPGRRGRGRLRCRRTGEPGGLARTGLRGSSSSLRRIPWVQPVPEQPRCRGGNLIPPLGAGLCTRGRVRRRPRGSPPCRHFTTGLFLHLLRLFLLHAFLLRGHTCPLAVPVRGTFMHVTLVQSMPADVLHTG